MGPNTPTTSTGQSPIDKKKKKIDQKKHIPYTIGDQWGKLAKETMEAASDVDCTQGRRQKEYGTTVSDKLPLILSKTGFLPNAGLPLHRKDLSALVKTKQTLSS